MPAAVEEAILRRTVAPTNMKLSVEEIELLDHYEKRILTQAEMAQIEERLRTDASFRQLAQDHLKLIYEVRRHDERARVRELLDAAHHELNTTTPAQAADDLRYGTITRSSCTIRFECRI